MMAYINKKGKIVPQGAYERDLAASMAKPGPHCPWCHWAMSDHGGVSVEACREAMKEQCARED